MNIVTSIERLAFVAFFVLFAFTSLIIGQRIPSSEGIQPRTTQIETLEGRIHELAKSIILELTESGAKTVVVSDFVDLNGRPSELGKFVAEELVTRIFQTRRLKVIERQRLDKVIAEQRLSLSDMIESSSAKRIGRILGADIIIGGSLTELASNFRINARIVNTETGELLSAAAVTLAKDAELCSLISCRGSLASANAAPRPSNSSPSSVNKQNSSSGTDSSRKAESDFFAWELHQCRLSGSSVICDFSVTNLDSDRQLGLQYTSELFDNSGNRSQAAYVELANAKSGGFTASAYSMLIKGVRTRARIRFDNVSPDATKISLLSLECTVNRKAFKIQIRDVPLLRAS